MLYAYHLNTPNQSTPVILMVIFAHAGSTTVTSGEPARRLLSDVHTEQRVNVKSRFHVTVSNGAQKGMHKHPNLHTTTRQNVARRTER